MSAHDHGRPHPGDGSASGRKTVHPALHRSIESMNPMKNTLSLLRRLTALSGALLAAPLLVSQVLPPQNDESEEDEPISLSAFEVKSTTESGYMASSATGATRTGTPLFDTPQTINVITKDLYNDLQAFETQDAIRYLTNIQPRVNTQSAWRIRGFFVAQNFKNGFVTDTSSRGDSANIEQIEVIKGPSAVVLGQVDPGGSVNQITKKPLFDAKVGEAMFTVGSYDYYRTAIDLGTPLGDSGKFAFRVNAAYVDDGHFQDHPGPGGEDLQFRKRFVAPSFGWKVSDNTLVYVELELSKEKNYNPIFTVGVPQSTGPYPDIKFLISPKLSPNHNWSYRNTDYWSLQASASHKFSNNWIFRQMVGLSQVKSDNFDAVNIGRRLNARLGDNFDLEYQGDLLGQIETGALKHKFLLGVTYADGEGFGSLRRRNIPGIDPYDPDYRTSPPDVSTIPYSNSIKSQRTRWSVLGQDQIDLMDEKLKILLGFRYEKLEASSKNFGVPQEETSDGVTAPRGGIVYQPNRNFSFFGVYSGSQRPQRVTRPDGSLITDAIEGNMVEVGVKSRLLNGRLSVQASYFDIVRKNVANGFTLPDGTETIEPSGEETATGIELEVAGNLMDNWQLLFSVGTIDTADGSTFLNYPGSKMGGTMDYTVRVWSVYDVVSGPLNGLEIGAGWVHNDGIYGEDATYITAPADIVEFRLGYKWKRVKVAVNVENVFNEEWWVDAPAPNLTLPGTPRRARMTMTYTW
jgi:iron complex outermembrane receptor protein